MQKLQSKKQITQLSILLCITYMISYVTRINYGAVISEMVSATGFSKSILSMAVTGSFVTYGAGQIVTGILGDKFSPKKLVSLGFCVTILMNLLIPICQNPYQMTAIWCINGFAQAFMWPPIVRMMTFLLTPEDYKKVTARVSFGSSFGTIAVYLISPILIAFSGWRAVFLFSAICGIAVLIYWNKCAQDITTESTASQKAKEKAAFAPLFTPLILAVMLAIILQGMLRDGVTTWMPTYISEVYNISNVISILTGVLLPLFSIACIQAGTFIYRKKIKNPLSCTALFFGTGVLSSVLLLLFSGENAAISVFSMALLTGAMHGANLMLVCMIPAFFQKFGNVSTASGVLNSCTYIGSAISTYGIALLSESFGWTFTLTSWLVIAALGGIICLLCIKPWKKNFS